MRTWRKKKIKQTEVAVINSVQKDEKSIEVYHGGGGNVKE